MLHNFLTTLKFRKVLKCAVSAGSGAASRLWRDRKATVAMTFSISMVPLIGFVTLGIEYGRSLDVKADYQHAVDGAVLAAASMQGSYTAAQRQTFADNYFAASLTSKSASTQTKSFTYNTTSGAMSGSVTAQMPTIMGVPAWAGMPAWTRNFYITVNSTATLGSKVRAMDVVMCIDATGSMQNTLNAVQTSAVNFKTNLDAALATYGIAQFDQMRVRVVYYRDFGGNGWQNLYPQSYYPVSGSALGDSVSLLASPFYTLPGSSTAYSTFVNSQHASGGGDLPESGLECLNEALNSTFINVGDALPDGRLVEVALPIVSIYTDAGAHPPNFQYSVANPTYPPSTNMPRTFAGLLAKWNDSTKIDQTNKMLLFYGSPNLQDDYYFNNTSAWTTIMTWPGFSNPGSLTSANTSFVSTLAAAIATGYHQPTLTQ